MRQVATGLLTLAALFLLSLMVGAADLQWSELLRLAKDSLNSDPPSLAQEASSAGSPGSYAALVLFELRLPRTLLAIMTGAALAVGGALMQSLFRNPLAEPGLVGVSAGSALGAAGAMMAGFYGYAAIGTAGVVGAFVATAIAWQFARNQPQTYALLLAGLAINAFSLSLITLLISLASDAQMRSIVFWSMGSFSRAPLWVVLSLVPAWLACMIWAMRSWALLNALLLGESQARHVGVNVSRFRWQLVLLMAVMLGPLVSMTGVISFVGLLVPQALRRRVGSNHARLLPLCAVWGAVVVLSCDMISRIVVAPAELPVGVVISLAGAPVFLWLLTRTRLR